MGVLSIEQLAAREKVEAVRAASRATIQAEIELLAGTAREDANISDADWLQVMCASANTRAASLVEADRMVQGAAASGAVKRILRTPAAELGLGPYRTCPYGVIMVLVLSPPHGGGGGSDGAAADMRQMARAMLDAVHPACGHHLRGAPSAGRRCACRRAACSIPRELLAYCARASRSPGAARGAGFRGQACLPA